MILREHDKRRFGHYEANGFLHITDWHADDTGPSTRVDDYVKAVTGKMRSAIGYANANKLIIILGGDNLGRPVIANEAFKGQIMRLFNESLYPVYGIPGNHEMSAKKLSERDSLWLMSEFTRTDILVDAGILDVMTLTDDSGQTTVVGLGGSPYGQSIPSAVDWGVDVDMGVWLTHHNLPFTSHYKKQETGAFKHIAGVDCVLNGHLHHAAPPVRSGETTYYNNGSITRTKSNERDRLPTITVVSLDGVVEAMPLDYNGADTVFSSGAGRTSAVDVNVRDTSDMRNRFVNFLSSDDHDQETVGNLLDDAMKGGEITHDMRDWLEGIAREAATRLN